MTKVHIEFIVVENAGYEGERDIKRFGSLVRATIFRKNFYRASEIREKHVDIAREVNGERSYEY